MGPGNNLGAATQVQIGGGGNPLSQPRDGDEKDETTAPKAEDASQAKARNDAIAYIRSLAELRGRNADWAEAAVQTAASLSANAAPQQNVIKLVARDRTDLIAQLYGRTVTIRGRDANDPTRTPH